MFVIVLDTCRADALSSYGGRDGITPELDRLAGEGALFERAFSPSPWTLTTMASLLSGRHPTVHGAFGYLQDVRPIREDVPLAAEMLAAAGYRTLAVANAPFVAPEFGFSRGFGVYDFYPSRNVDTRRASVSVNAALAHLDDALNDDPNAPVFFMLHLFDPHMAYDPPPSTLGRYTSDYDGELRAPFSKLKEIRLGSWSPKPRDVPFVRGLYDEEVAAADAEIGRFLDGLRSRELYDEALIVFTSDHGEEFWEHGGFEHGHTMHTELVHVPLVVKLPEGIPRSSAGTRVAAQVRLLDVLPTILQLADLEIPDELPGRSLTPLLTGDGEANDRPALSERVHLPPEQIALRDGRWTYMFTPRTGERRLYDAVADPSEQDDLAAIRPELTERLHQRLIARMERLDAEAAELSSSGDMQLDDELKDQLRSLGYLGD